MELSRGKTLSIKGFRISDVAGTEAALEAEKHGSPSVIVLQQTYITRLKRV